MEIVKSLTQFEKLPENQYYIYALENTDHLIKIGRTHDIQERVRSLSGSNGGGHKITRVAVSKPTYLATMETTLHTHYNWNRITNTEWFAEITLEEVVEFVNSLFNHPSYEKLNELRRQEGGYHRRRGCRKEEETDI